MKFKQKILNQLYIRLLLLYKCLKNIEIIRKFKKIDILDDEESIKMIVENKMSVARFGDGEFGFLISDQFAIGFQEYSSGLKEKLKLILKENKLKY